MTLQRTIDASLNRLAEGLRVMEDLARYVLNDPELSRDCKSIRHEARRLPDRWPVGWIEARRDVAGDVGTDIEAPDESVRSGTWEVAVAAAHRAAEAMRTVEECCKVVDRDAAQTVESMRYRLYEIDARLRRGLASRRVRQWSLCVLLTEERCRHDWLEVAAAAVASGSDCLQLREKNLPDPELLSRTRALIELARPAGCSVVVNDRIDIALAADADGVHLGRDDLPVAEARRLAGGQLIIGASTHGPSEAQAAVDAGADVLGVGPMFTSRTRPDLEPAGAERLAKHVAAWSDTPHLAIGGIDRANLPLLIESGCRGIAVCDAVCGADDPAAEVEAMLDLLHRSQPV
tara:strand:+ start:4951 stop:5991 length:1041 start_codon:yes stop_codon:yes gene_type:complete